MPFFPLQYNRPYTQFQWSRATIPVGFVPPAADTAGRTPHFTAVPHHLPVVRVLVDEDPRAVRTLVDGSGVGRGQMVRSVRYR